ncbi:MAG: hypothetical protein GC191_09450 [Azospirillum sp.]|nr:hypothetical protein [Azospirillum sp.]
MPHPHFFPRPVPAVETEPFASPEEAWFWFVQAHEAATAGARIAGGQGDILRPCEPNDIMLAVDRLYRRHRLRRDHLCVLADYGRQLMPPDPERRAEQRAYGLWREAFDRLAPVLRDKGIVRR